MKVSVKCRYAVRMMVDIAIHNTGKCIALKDISKRQNISVKYLEQVVGPLTAAGYLKSVRGPQGGYMLPANGEAVSVGDIIRVMEGGICQVPCSDGNAENCERYDICEVRAMWDGLHKIVVDYLDNITLNDLAQKSRHTIRDDYSI